MLGLGKSGDASSPEIDGIPIAITGASNIQFNSLEQKRVDKLEDKRDAQKTLMIEVQGLNILVKKNFAISWKIGIQG